MLTDAVVMEAPHRLDIRSALLDDPSDGDLVIDIHHSGISTGTEKLLYEGRMPDFPGMGYPLIPGYESVGTVVDAGRDARHRIGEAVFVPGAKCFTDMRALFGGAARTLVVPETRAVPDPFGDSRGVLLALAATAHHALAAPGAAMPDLVIGHGTVGRLLTRIAIAKGAHAPVVWEREAVRREGADYAVVAAEDDPARDYRSVYDCTGDAAILDTVMPRLAKGGEIVLAGFYAGRVAFDFAPAFMREARIRIAAEWHADDMAAVRDLIERGRLSFDGLVTDHAPVAQAAAAYERAFSAPDCLKMILDWKRP